MTPQLLTVPLAEYLAHPAYSASDLRAFRFGPPAIRSAIAEVDALQRGLAAHDFARHVQALAAEARGKLEELGGLFTVEALNAAAMDPPPAYDPRTGRWIPW